MDRPGLRGQRDYYYTRYVNKSRRLGPAPWRPVAQTDQPPAERLLVVLAERVLPATTADLVAASGLHANTVRAHLQDLVERGLVSVTPVPSGSRGRPVHEYVITDQGRAVPRVNDPAFAEYRGLTTAFASYLAARTEHPGEEARAIGRAWGIQLGADPSLVHRESSAQEAVMPLLARLGFTPVPPADGADARTTGIALHTCPLLELAEEMPEVICQVHQGLIEGALEAGGAPPTAAELRPFSEPGACRLYLRDTEAPVTSPEPPGTPTPYPSED